MSARCRTIAALNENHQGDEDSARRLIDAAREAGADGVKFRKRTVSLAGVRQLLDSPVPRYRALGPTYRKVLERLDFSVDTLARLREHAAGIEFVVAPYDQEAWRQLDGGPWSAWKVDSAPATHLPLLTALGDSKYPVAASTGGCTRREIEAILQCLGSIELTLVHALHLPSVTAGVLDVAYLVPLARFGRPVGYEDHEPGISLALTAVALGAVLIEKPLALERGSSRAPGLAPEEFRELVCGIRALENLRLNGALRNPSPEEMDELERERPGVVAAIPILRGTVITREMLTLKPPARGLSPRLLPLLEGRRALYDIPEDEPITFGMVGL